ncbi:MAG: phosphoribosyl-AMP cyclohydrolase [Chloroflexi bacterium HGW-Chloroflexi-10]|nr:MAG: phosphoribosyl-AMP cyclohydrolase [Chloroflexi bacterium HGW-Chloroflexi-10]
MNLDFSQLKTDPLGLIPAVIQDTETLQVLMVGWMNRQSYEATLETGLVTFWSRSRQQLWQKGESSGNTLHLSTMWVDCDKDTLLILAHPVGPTCHTGSQSCFFTTLDAGSSKPDSTISRKLSK